MAYHYSKKLTVDNNREAKPDGMRWRTPGHYIVRSDGGDMSTHTDTVHNLTEARRVAKLRARACGWSEIFRFAEDATKIKPFCVATYERELSA